MLNGVLNFGEYGLGQWKGAVEILDNSLEYSDSVLRAKQDV